MRKKADMIIDLQFGSTGKGLIAGFLAFEDQYDTVVNANMPNAGHTYIDSDGNKYIFKVLPSGAVSPSVKTVMIGPGSIFNIDRLWEEWDQIPDRANKTLIIHEDAVPLNPSHKATEAKTMNKISSTMQGSGAAMIEKILRDPESVPIATNSAVRGHCVNNDVWMQYLNAANKILIEGAQGYSLGINAGFYPYCTSRDCTPARFLADCGVPIPMLRKVIGTARVHPIRVGSTPDGYSGDCYKDQKELDWEELGQTPETTTVTGRIRRVFTFSHRQIRAAIEACQPDEIFLNFVNYDVIYAQCVWADINNVLRTYGPEHAKVQYLGVGPTHHDVLHTQYWPEDEFYVD